MGRWRAFIPCCKIGRNFTIVGGGLLMDYGTKEIGDDVWVGTGVKGVGKIRIGNRVRLAPNTVVMKDVPDDTFVREPGSHGPPDLGFRVWPEAPGLLERAVCSCHGAYALENNELGTRKESLC